MTTAADPTTRPYVIGGSPVEEGEAFDVTFPWDDRLVARVRLADETAVERALATASAAAPATAALAPFERADVLNRAADLVEARAEELARQITLETGNAIWETRLEVRRTTEILHAAADEARRVVGEIIPIDGWPNGAGRKAHTQRFPVGLVLAITPYNAPLLLVAHKLAAAYAAGNPCIVRPASKTPLSALSLGEIFVEAGALPEAISVVPCPSPLGERMARDERVKMLSFTGSEDVGWHLQKVAATPRVALELGGNGVVIVHSDANLDYAAQRCAFGGFLRAGQACISVQRVLVADDVADEFVDRLSAKINDLVLGDPLDDATTIGVLVDDAAAHKAVELVDEAVAAGARVVRRGERDGRLMDPVVLEGAPRTTRIAQAEAFAPIIGIERYSDIDDAIAVAGDSKYGLQAGLFTNDIRIIYRAFERIEVGALIVNDVNTFRVDHMPYGGAKRSGLGREGVRYAIREMTEERMLVIDPRC